MQDLSNYKYSKMVNRSLALLNKFYSAKSRMFKMAVQAMVSYLLAHSISVTSFFKIFLSIRAIPVIVNYIGIM